MADQNARLTLSGVKDLLFKTYDEFSRDNVPRLGAALSFYTMLSLAPLLIVVIAICALVLGEEAARGQIEQQIQGMVGQEGAQAIQTMISSSRKPGAGLIASLLGLVTLFFGATGVVAELRDAMNQIWNVPAKQSASGLGSIVEILRDRSYAFAVVLSVGFLLLVSLVVSAWLAALGKLAGSFLPIPEVALQVISLLISTLIIAGLFALMFKLLPDIDVQWRDVVIGAIVTAVLFSIGKTLIGLYLGKASIGSTYGAAGSLVVVLVWVYYSAQIFFFGAEFTQVYANEYGSRPRPRPQQAGGAGQLSQEGQSAAPAWQSQSAGAARDKADLPPVLATPPADPAPALSGTAGTVGAILAFGVALKRAFGGRR